MAQAYFVWRRNDGYVNASANRMPNDYENPNNGVKVTFEKIGVFTFWHDAYQMIEQERQKCVFIATNEK